MAEPKWRSYETRKRARDWIDKSRSKKSLGMYNERQIPGGLYDLMNQAYWGFGQAGNDIVNFVDPEPGYSDRLGMDQSVFHEPTSEMGKAGSDLARYGALTAGPMAAMGALGAPAVLSFPASWAAATTMIDPWSDRYLTTGEYYQDVMGKKAPKILDWTVRREDDPEWKLRARQLGSGVMEGALMDAPIAHWGMKALPPAMAGYMYGLPYGIDYLTGDDADQ